MNQENTELFFGDEQDVILTLEVEDGTEIKVTPLASFEIEELGTEYVIAAELEDDEETMTGEVQILKYEEIWNGIGNPVYPPAKRELAKHGIGCDGKRAVQLKKSDYDKYDYFICMDSNNIRNTMRIFGDDKDGKVCKMMSFAGMNRDVSDPWYSGDFEQAYNDIYSGCKGLFEKFKGKA